MRNYNNESIVEKIASEKFGSEPIYPPTEKIRVVIVPDFPTLGRLTSLRFIEWLQLNPEGVISLPTGKTPEYFIKWTLYYLNNWYKKDIQKELSDWGLNTETKPKMDTYYFVQIDEFYPMNPDHENSFAYYIKKFYFKGFGLNPKKALLMDTWYTGAYKYKNLSWIFPDNKVDLSLRIRQPTNKLEQLQYQAITAIDQFAMEYELKIAQLGGIGFFLGGIGPDGHIGFNIRGSDHNSTTRLIPINYETAAAAAVDLGGIEVSRQKVVLTIGLKTITQNPTTTVIIIAAGASKSAVVKSAIEKEPSVLYPGTALQVLTGARFYLTKGSASELIERRYNELKKLDVIPYQACERILIDIAEQKKKIITDINKEDLITDKLGKLLLEKKVNLKSIIKKIDIELKNRIAEGTKNIEGLTFLHTAPHHDDIMLGYLPYIVHIVRSPKNSHYFATLTSGFTSVTNSYTLSMIQNLETHLRREKLSELIKTDYFKKNNIIARNEDVYLYLDGVANNSIDIQKEAEARRMLRNMVELTGTLRIDKIKTELKKIKNNIVNSYPGKKDTPLIQKLKGMIREWEEELLWGHLGFNSNNIFHLRLGFYTGDIFTPQPEWGRDIKPVLKLIETVNPDIITVALDPEASGPDTHYKVLQIISAALKLYLKKNPHKKLKILGYRNVWYRFHPSESNIFVPVSMNSFAIIRSAFHTCFGSQRSASFPSYEYDGPFCDLSQKIMVEQFNTIKECLGKYFFYTNPVPRLRASRGMNLLRYMTPQEFFKEALELRKLTESV